MKSKAVLELEKKIELAKEDCSRWHQSMITYTKNALKDNPNFEWYDLHNRDNDKHPSYLYSHNHFSPRGIIDKGILQANAKLRTLQSELDLLEKEKSSFESVLSFRAPTTAFTEPEEHRSSIKQKPARPK